MSVLGSILIKPEGTALLKYIQNGLIEFHSTLDLPRRRIVEAIISGVKVLESSSYIDFALDKNLIYVESGLMSPTLFDIVYPEYTIEDPPTRSKMQLHYIYNRYNLIFFSVDSLDTQATYKFLQSLKGKMSSLDPNLATGLRGYLLRSVINSVPYYEYSTDKPLLNYYHENRERWHQTGNFIHAPDNEQDSINLYEHVCKCSKQRNESFERIYSKGKRNLSIWDIYKIADQQLYLDKQRTRQEIQLLRLLIPLPQYRNILDLGCGDGRISIYLARNGYNVVGIDFDGKAISKAIEKSGELGLRNILFQVWSFKGFTPVIYSCFDAAILTYAALTYMTHKELKELLHNVYQSLRSGGMLLLDLLSGDVLSKQPKGKEKNLSEHYDFSKFGIQELKRKRIFNNKAGYEKTVFTIETLKGRRVKIIYCHEIPYESKIKKLLKSAGFSNVVLNPSYKNNYPLLRERLIITAHK